MIEHLTSYPRRIVCLTEETTETLYLLGEQERIVGVSGYTVRPPEARLKPKVSAFINAKFDKILALEPDLVFAFSDLQADIAAELIRRGVTVMTFNQRSIAEILEMILTVGRIIGSEEKARALVSLLQTEADAIRDSASRFAYRPRVLFEEWYEPLISGICWVEELIETAGGECIFPELRGHQSAKNRIVNPADVITKDPEVIIGSWCGRAVKREWIRKRDGWDQISAIRNNHIYEVKSAYILQPGPAALTEGLRQLHAILAHAVNQEIEPDLLPKEKTDAALGLPPPDKPIEHAALQ
ncbi:MAG TPA: cobalamin-binding protein [Pyrinomonadaceae bacterium]|nr:cobalamin-binding protein [Pyrinomonadaceae bacterium]